MKVSVAYIAALVLSLIFFALVIVHQDSTIRVQRRTILLLYEQTIPCSPTTTKGRA